jgi:hypothetical protein
MEASLLSDTMIANRYRILARIGEGGFGTVYKARVSSAMSSRATLCLLPGAIST